ncbi:MAG: DUF4876 domain-containing protein [Candidatus Symbiothrix sp.]|jgi:hypothetical protein|nr:DUF4876 domain-containing protein [Candidatus Symbiothrix sp.]
MKQAKVRWSKLLMCVIALAFTFAGYSCVDDNKLPEVQTYQVKVQLAYTEGYAPREGVSVKLKNAVTNTISEQFTDATGTAAFEAIAGVYEVSVSETRTIGLNKIVFNGTKSGIIVTTAWDAAATATVPLVESKTNQLVIKELYNGGCQKDDGSGSFTGDQYVILYNNSDQPASLENLAFGYLFPNTSQGSNNFYVNGTLYYEAQGWLPAGYAIWAFRENVTLAPGEQLVVAIQGAVNNTLTYSNSINFANPAYYAMYDPEIFAHATAYPAPAEVIPASHYLKAYKFANVTSTAWALSVTSPAFIIFRTEGITPGEFAVDMDRIVLNGTSASQAGRKVPVEWVVDGIEIYAKGNAANKKRLTSTIDGGYMELTNAQGHTLYRNVDKEATEAIASNAGKLVEGYAADPSGIDAEASIKNGAYIIYKDTNNSTNDFHERSKASLRN